MRGGEIGADRYASWLYSIALTSTHTIKYCTIFQKKKKIHFLYFCFLSFSVYYTMNKRYCSLKRGAETLNINIIISILDILCCDVLCLE